jgi:hypothetical protein
MEWTATCHTARTYRAWLSCHTQPNAAVSGSSNAAHADCALASLRPAGQMIPRRSSCPANGINGKQGKNDMQVKLYDSIPTNLCSEQRERTEFELSRMACMMVDWFADRAFTCPDSLHDTIETYKNLIVATAHDAVV